LEKKANVVADNNVLQAFTELAPHYEETIDKEVRQFCGLGYREFVGQLVNRVPIEQAEAILDLACGTAVSSLEIAERAAAESRIVGLDITPAMLESGATNIGQAGGPVPIDLVCGSAMDMPLPNHSFDTVVCALGMHHMSVPKLLQETARVLKSNGHLIMADMGAPSNWRSAWGRALMKTIVAVLRIIRREARWQAEADAFHSIHTAEEWREILSSFGFSQVDIVEWAPRRFWYPCALIMKASKVPS
jgi:ubiquinone/menaquinone biosynthesis C-methylase UbiE